jgi:hypothetical protein
VFELRSHGTPDQRREDLVRVGLVEVQERRLAARRDVFGARDAATDGRSIADMVDRVGRSDAVRRERLGCNS